MNQLMSMLLVVASTVFGPLHVTSPLHLTAYFTEAVGVYAGSDVRVLGVRVGTVDEVRPAGTQVRVRLTVEPGVRIPRGVKAVIMAPSLVSDRFVQLAPAYTTGPELPRDSTIREDSTATPVELDQLYGSLNELATALGPNGANAHGALSDLVKTGAEVLDGNGAKLNETIERLGAAAGTLFGVSDVAIKALAEGGVVSPWLPVAAAASVLAFLASARGFQEGDAVPVIACTSTAANVTVICGGIVVFGDALAGGVLLFGQGWVDPSVPGDSAAGMAQVAHRVRDWLAGNGPLLVGSLLLFAVLAAIMAATRRFDWYRLGGRMLDTAGESS